jgi:hypothetical protein
MARNHKAGGQGEPHAARMGEVLCTISCPDLRIVGPAASLVQRQMADREHRNRLDEGATALVNRLESFA